MSRTMPYECEHGTVIDWGDFAPVEAPEPICGACLRPGQAVQHATTGTVVVLDRRKVGSEAYPLSGWWLRDGKGGLADRAIQSGEWSVVDAVRPDDCPTCGQVWSGPIPESESA